MYGSAIRAQKLNVHLSNRSGTVASRMWSLVTSPFLMFPLSHMSIKMGLNDSVKNVVGVVVFYYFSVNSYIRFCLS